MGKIVMGAVVAVLATVMAWPVSAHPVSRFQACTVAVPGGCESIAAAFIFGDTVIVNGRARPKHADREALVLRKRPHGSVFRVVGAVTVNDRGRMRLEWATDSGDAVQDAPYRFRFRIRGHGVSTPTEAHVLFGE